MLQCIYFLQVHLDTFLLQNYVVLVNLLEVLAEFEAMSKCLGS